MQGLRTGCPKDHNYLQPNTMKAYPSQITINKGPSAQVALLYNSQTFMIEMQLKPSFQKQTDMIKRTTNSTDKSNKDI